MTHELDINDVILPEKIPPRFPSLIYLNGPAGSGKTTLADYLCSLDPGIIVYHHATPLWHMADVIQSALHPDKEIIDFNLQDVKSLSLRSDDSSPLTWRDFLLHQGAYIREAFGASILSTIAAAEARHYLLTNRDTVIFPAIRTLDDLSSLLPLVPLKDQLLLRIERSGCSWEGDLGGYITPDITSVTIRNDNSLQDFFNTAVAYLTE